jgi:hypothetical protein
MSSNKMKVRKHKKLNDGLFIFYRALLLQNWLNKETTDVVGVSRVLTIPSLSARQKDYGLVFSITTNGPVHLGSSFPIVSV